MSTVFYEKDDEVFNPLYDFVFKTVFTRETEESRTALKGLLSALVGRQVAEISVKQNELAVDHGGERRVKFDINCKFNDGELADIEMTMNPLSCEQSRIEYYLAKLLTSQELTGIYKDFSQLKNTYQINIINGKLFENSSYIHYYKTVDQMGEEIPQKGQRIVLELPKIDYSKPLKEMTRIEKWAKFFVFASDMGRREEINILFEQTEEIAMAGASLLTISKDEHERARLLSEHKYQMDIQCRMIDAENKGLQKGEVIGLQKGEVIGLQKGEAIGLQKGDIIRATKTAQKLLKRGLDPKDIAEDTELTLAEVQKIQAEMEE